MTEHISRSSNGNIETIEADDFGWLPNKNVAMSVVACSESPPNSDVRMSEHVRTPSSTISSPPTCPAPQQGIEKEDIQLRGAREKEGVALAFSADSSLLLIKKFARPRDHYPIFLCARQGSRVTFKGGGTMTFKGGGTVGEVVGAPSWVAQRAGIASQEFWDKLTGGYIIEAFGEVEETYRSAIIALIMLLFMVAPNFMFRGDIR